MAASADHEESYCVQEEIELLEAIFIHELSVNESSERQLSLSITLHPSTGDEEHKKYVCLTLDIELPLEYPNVLPSIVIRSPRGLSEAHVNSIFDNLQELARERLGSPMLYELIQYAKDSLTDNNIPSCECAICLCHFQDNDSFTRTECYHFFHCSCLARFIEFSLKQEDKEEIECPVCRLPVMFDLDTLKAALVTDTEKIEITYKPSNEIKQLQSKMAAIYEEQKRKGGIIDVEQERNKFLIDISSTPQQSTEQEPSELALVLQLHLDEAVISKVKSPQAKEQEDPGTKERHPKSIENHGRKTPRQQNSSKASSRNSPRPTKKNVPERAHLDQDKCKLQVEKRKKEKDMTADNYSSKDDSEKGKQNNQNKTEKFGDSENNGKECSVNTKEAFVNNPREASQNDREKTCMKGDSKKPKFASGERKNNFKSDEKKSSDENICSTAEQTSRSFKSNQINPCSVVETSYKEKCMSAKAKMVVEEGKASHSSGGRRRGRGRRRERYANQDVSRTDKPDEMAKRMPKTDIRKEIASSTIIDEMSTDERDQETKMEKFDGRQRNDSQQNEKERNKIDKPRHAARSEGSEKELKDLNRPLTNDNKERLSKDCTKESVKKDWPDLKSDAQTQRTTDECYTHKKQSKKSKNSQEHQDIKSQPLTGSGTQPGWSDVAKLGLLSTSKAASQSFGNKSDAKHHHQRDQGKRQKREKIPQGIKGSTHVVSKSENQEQYNKVELLGVKPPPGFERKSVTSGGFKPPPGLERKCLTSGGFKPPPGFEDKVFEKPVGWNPPPGFENLDLKAETTKKTKTHQR